MSSWMVRNLGAAVLLAAGVATVTDAQPLRDLADRRGLLIGSYDTGLDFDDRAFPIWLGPTAYATTLSREFNTIVINVSMPTMQPERGQFYFEYADSAIAFAKRNDMKVIGHHLLWGAGFPEGFWIGEPLQAPCNSDSMYAILENHVRTIVRRYAGDIYAYSAVNEELVFGTTDWDTGSWRSCVAGDFIDSVFVWAKDEDPNLKLYYNETNAEGTDGGLVGRRSDAVYERVARMNRDGIPIDGVGMQMHVSLGGNVFEPPRGLTGLQEDMTRYADLGLQVFFSEIDVTTSTGGGELSQRLEAQGKVYADLLRICLANDNCALFNVWGVADQYSWVFYAFNDSTILPYPDESPMLFDSLFVAKPAYDSLVVAFERHVPTAVEDAVNIIPGKSQLAQNYPNPFNPTTTIDYDLTDAAPVSLRIYDLAGQQIVTLVTGIAEAGHHQVTWDGKDALDRDVASGVYLYQLKVGTMVMGKKLLLMR